MDRDPSTTTTQVNLTVQNMDCASCVSHVDKAIRKLPGVEAVQVNLATARAKVVFDPTRVGVQQLTQASTDAGYPAALVNDAQTAQARRSASNDAAGYWRNRAIVGLLLWLPVESLHWTLSFAGHVPHASHGQVDWMTWLALGASTIAMLYIGLAFVRNAVRGLVRGQINMDLLIAIGGWTSYLYSLTSLVGHLAGWWAMPANVYFMEGAALMALISLGHHLEWRARDKASQAIRGLMDLAPDTAARLVNYSPPSTKKRVSLTVTAQPTQEPSEETISSSLLTRGDFFRVKPGARIAADGVVVEGSASIDESMLSGEPLPVTRNPGDDVFGGTINRDGSLVIRVTRQGTESALAQVVRLVEEAQNAKPPVQRIADQIAAVFVPVVLVIALITGVGWYLWASHHGWGSGQTWAMIARCVCSVLIIACPCALGIALPAALMVGTGAAARRGIVIKNLAALQAAKKVDTVVMDKTGTITRGRPVVSSVVPEPGVSSDELLRLAASGEQFSEHPLARAIVRHAKQLGLRLVAPTTFSTTAGGGVSAVVEGKQIKIGTAEFAGVEDDLMFANESVSHVTRLDGQAVTRLGTIHLADQIKPDSKEAIAHLRRQGFSLLMLSGDTQAAAVEIGRQVGLEPEEVRGRLKPGEKEAIIRELQQSGKVVAMVGDGINDAPALSRADLGIAIGSGSDIAKESGGIVLVGNSLTGVGAALAVGRKTMRVIHQNFFWAFAYNVVAIPLAALGFLTPLIAAAAMMLSDVTVIANALRLRKSADPPVEQSE